MIKYVLLLCLLLHLGACRKVHLRQVKDVVKEDKVVQPANEPHVVKKDHPQEDQAKQEKHKENIVKSDESQEEEQVKPINPEEMPDKSEEEAVKVDEEESIQEPKTVDDSRGTPKQGLLSQGEICRVNNELGSCFVNSLQCLTKRGTILGTLGASGQCPPLGVCCQESKTCGQSSFNKAAVFSSPHKLTADLTSCDFTIHVVDKDICQIRIDFDMFQLANPRQMANVAKSGFSCLDDSFTIITPNNEPMPIICGFNSGQHMYLRVNHTNGERSIRLRLNLAARPGMVNGAALPDPTWRIRITQLECQNTILGKIGKGRFSTENKDHSLLAPPGCLQYFTQRTGTVRNFGFNPNVPLANNNYLVNMDYSICFKRSPTTCGMKFSPGGFRMSGNANNCANDFLFIPEGIITAANGNTNQAPFSEVCGNALPDNTFIQSVGNFPTFIHFRTDNQNDNNENGFNLNYEVPPTNNCA